MQNKRFSIARCDPYKGLRQLPLLFLPKTFMFVVLCCSLTRPRWKLHFAAPVIFTSAVVGFCLACLRCPECPDSDPNCRLNSVTH